MTLNKKPKIKWCSLANINNLNKVWEEIPQQVDHERNDPETGMKVGWYEQLKINRIKNSMSHVSEVCSELIDGLNKFESIMPTPQCRDVLSNIINELGCVIEYANHDMGTSMKEAYLEGEEYEKYMAEWEKENPSIPLDEMLKNKIEALEKELASTKELMAKFEYCHKRFK